MISAFKCLNFYPSEVQCYSAIRSKTTYSSTLISPCSYISTAQQFACHISKSSIQDPLNYYIYYTRTGCLPEQINSLARSFRTYFSNLLIKTPWSSFIEINFINRERLSCPFRTWFKTCFPIQGYGKYKSDCAAPLYSWERLFTSVRAVECTLNGDWDALGASIDFLSLSKGICDVMIETRNQVISLFGCNLFFNFLNYPAIFEHSNCLILILIEFLHHWNLL